MAIVKRCELCELFIKCEIYEKVCEDLAFLRENFFDIKESQEIAKFCNQFKR